MTAFFFDQLLLSYNHSISILQDVSWMNYDTKVRWDRFSLSYETRNSHHLTSQTVMNRDNHGYCFLSKRVRTECSVHGSDSFQSEC